MNQIHPALLDLLVRDRVAELRQSGAGVRIPREKPRRHPVEAARRGTGWLLVDLGLRLAVPGRPRPSRDREAMTLSHESRSA